MPSIEPLEPRIAPAAMLHMTGVDAKIPPTSVPGDIGTVKFTVQNNGDAPSTKTGIYISLSPGPDTNLVDDITLASFEDSALALAPGGAKTLARTFKMPALRLPFPTTPSGTYYVVVDVREADNSGFDAAHPTLYVFQAGEVGGRTGVALNGKDPDGTSFSLKVSGPGTAALQFGSGGADLALISADKDTVVRVLGGGGTDGTVAFHSITAPDQIKGFVGKILDTTGNLGFNGGLEALVLHNIGSPAAHTVLNVGAGDDQPVKMAFTKVTEMDFNVTGGIEALLLGQWDDTNSTRDNLNALFIDRLEVGNKAAGLEGNLVTNLILSGANAQGVALGSATIGGQIYYSQWNISGGNVGKITADSANHWQLDVSNGFVNDIALKHDFLGDRAAPNLKAQTFHTIDIGGYLEAGITATAANAKGVAIGKLFTGQVRGIVLSATAGGIESLNATQWIAGGRIDALWIDDLTTKGVTSKYDGIFTPDLNLTGEFGRKKLSLGTADISGDVTGVWNLKGSADQISVIYADPAWRLQGGYSDGQSFSEIEATGDLAGEITGRAIGTMKVAGTLSAKITLLDNQAGTYLHKIIAGNLNGAVIDAGSESSMESITTGEWLGGSLRTRFLTKLVVLGNSKSSVRGDLANVNIRILGSALISQIFVRGAMTSVNIDTTSGSPDESYLASLHAGEWNGGSYKGGSIGTLDIGGTVASGNLQNVTINLVTPFLQSIGLLDVAKSMSGSHITTSTGIKRIAVGAMLSSTITSSTEIGKFEIEGFKGLVGPAFDSSQVSATEFLKLIVRDINEAGSAEYGFTADSVASYMRFTGTERVIFQANLTTQQDFDQVPAAGGGYRVHVT